MESDGIHPPGQFTNLRAAVGEDGAKLAIAELAIGYSGGHGEPGGELFKLLCVLGIKKLHKAGVEGDQNVFINST